MEINLPAVCPDCGMVVDASWLFCNNCGRSLKPAMGLSDQTEQPAPVEVPVRKSSSPGSGSSRLPWLLAVVGLCGLTVLVTLVFFVFLKGNSSGLPTSLFPPAQAATPAATSILVSATATEIPPTARSVPPTVTVLASPSFSPENIPVYTNAKKDKLVSENVTDYLTSDTFEQVTDFYQKNLAKFGDDGWEDGIMGGAPGLLRQCNSTKCEAMAILKKGDHEIQVIITEDDDKRIRIRLVYK
jgi:hypothetical protein